jgi:hypothetical protein
MLYQLSTQASRGGGVSAPVLEVVMRAVDFQPPEPAQPTRYNGAWNWRVA